MFSVERSIAESPVDGTRHDFYRIHSGSWAQIVPVTKEGDVVLVRQYRHGARVITLEMPAGLVDPGEDPAQAAARECLEETGLSVRVNGILDIISGKEHPRGADFIIVYQAEVISGELKPDDDADAAEWFTRENLPPLAFRATQIVLSRIV